MTTTTTSAPAGVDRRTLIRRAAAAGAVAWTAPVLLDSVASPAAATSPQNLGSNCYKYMYNWRWADEIATNCNSKWPPGSAEGSQNQPAPECQQSFNETSPNQLRTSQSCCRVTVNFNPSNATATCQSGNVREWYQLVDTPAGCVTVTTNQACASSSTGVSVTFSMNSSVCPNCWMADWVVMFSQNPSALSPVNCDNISPSTSNGGGSLFYSSMTFNFTGSKVPIWFKFTVGCGLKRQSEGNPSCSDNVPNTQNNCLNPGSLTAAGGAGVWNI